MPPTTTPARFEQTAAREPLTWRQGVLDRFGWAIGPDGQVRLVELVRHIYGAESTVTCLHTGDRLLLPGDGSWEFLTTTGPQACAAVGIPAPLVDGNSGEGARRADPFHVERHRSPWFCATLALIRERRLPTGYNLRAVADGEDFTVDGEQSYEAGESFCARVSERRCAQGIPQRAAILEQLDIDLLHLPIAARTAVIAETDWPAALDALDGHHTFELQRIPALELPNPIDVQLSLLG